jgi:two-component system chemotaxis sensor kinase CheA
MPVPNEIIQEFLVETHDGLGRLDVELVALEKGEAKAETLGSIFRTVHSLKGSAGFLGFQKLESLTHVAESLLSRLRDGKLTVNVEIVSTLLATVNAVRAMLRSIELNGQDGDKDHLNLIAALRALTANEPLPAAAAAAARPAKADELTIDLVVSPPVKPTAPVPPDQDSRTASPFVRETSPKQKSKAESSPIVQSPESDIHLEIAATQPVSSKVADSTIRLGIERVDKMMNLVTELVLSRNQIMQHSVVQTNSSLAVAARNLNLITSELQESVMKMRMQPISNVWSTLPRVVRDLSLECGKRVRLVMEGADTELDKSVLEAIKDPLTHLVRNAIDHGLETPEVRQSRGKPAESCLRLRAFHESGHIHIEISDDGAGIDRSRVKAKAREGGLLTTEQAEKLSDESVLSLIFLQGFSTRDAVSNLSGRGVGMDVVKSNVERIGGMVDVQSTLGTGTTFKLRIPLTLAIIHALMVTNAGERYAIPQTSMIELIRLDGDRARTGIERIHGVQVHRYRGKLLPLVSLSHVLGGADVNSSESVNIVVLQADQQQFGLIVDRVNDTQEIVVKPLNKLLRGISCLTGATILGDGQVALILDVSGVADRALGEVRQHSTGTAEMDLESSTVSQDIQQVVLVSGPNGERLAVPLSSVARLEEFPATKIEWTGTRPVIQYRNEILPLADVLGMLGERPSTLSVGWDSVPTDARVGTESPTATSRPIQVVVCTDGTSRVGLVVGRILDIVTDPLLVRSSSAREHSLFTTVVHSQATEVLNVASLIATAEANLVRPGAKT